LHTYIVGNGMITASAVSKSLGNITIAKHLPKFYSKIVFQEHNLNAVLLSFFSSFIQTIGVFLDNPFFRGLHFSYVKISIKWCRQHFLMGCNFLTNTRNHSRRFIVINYFPLHLLIPQGQLIFMNALSFTQQMCIQFLPWSSKLRSFIQWMCHSDVCRFGWILVISKIFKQITKIFCLFPQFKK